MCYAAISYHATFVDTAASKPHVLPCQDILQNLSVLNRLVDMGNTVVVIEHNLDVIKLADYIIDLGPEGGDAGGWIVATGTPEDICKVKKSYTGRFLKDKLR